MARNYRPVHRDQPFLVPPDMRDWLPVDHLVWFVLEVVDQLDTGSLHAGSRRGGTGREGFDPEVLLAVWVYATARGIHSSRQIERACSEDVAFRVLCAQDVPDHTVLARFRQRHQDVMADLFGQVLALCVGQGLGRFGVIAIDGTKIHANASKDRNRTLKRLRELAAAELEKAEATDQAEDAAGAPSARDDVPPGLGPGADRAARIRAAIADLEQVVEEENQPRLDKFQARLVKAETRLAARETENAARRDAYDAAVAAGRRPGRKPMADTWDLREARRGVEHSSQLIARAKRHAGAEATGDTDRTRRSRRILQRNVTDPRSRLMHTRNGYIQGYNAQLAVTDDQLILAVSVTDQPNDLQQLIPMMEQIETAVTVCEQATDRTDLTVGIVLADAGYLSDNNVAATGYDRLIAPGRGRIDDGHWKGEAKGRDGDTTTDAAQAMLTKMAEPSNQALYKRRAPIVEPVNAHLKDRRGLRRFSRRGLEAVNAELNMAALTTNLMKLFTTTWAPARTAT